MDFFLTEDQKMIRQAIRELRMAHWDSQFVELAQDDHALLRHTNPSVRKQAA